MTIKNTFYKIKQEFELIIIKGGRGGGWSRNDKFVFVFFILKLKENENEKILLLKMLTARHIMVFSQTNNGIESGNSVCLAVCL